VLFQQWEGNGDELKNASKLIVGPGQGCIFVYEGKVKGVYEIHEDRRKPFNAKIGQKDHY
jgi:membrane protease subunit (stomatin/prohibitin family)